MESLNPFTIIVLLIVPCNLLSEQLLIILEPSIIMAYFIDFFAKLFVMPGGGGTPLYTPKRCRLGGLAFFLISFRFLFHTFFCRFGNTEF